MPSLMSSMLRITYMSILRFLFPADLQYAVWNSITNASQIFMVIVATSEGNSLLAMFTEVLVSQTWESQVRD
jgi:hypothetical protein